MTYITNGERWQITRGKINKVVKVGYTDLLADTELTYTNQLGVIVTAGDLYPTTDGNWFEVAAPGAVNQHITTAGGVKFYEAGPHFSSRSRAVAAWARMDARSETPPVGTVWTFDGVSIEYDGSTTGMNGLPRWKPAGDVFLDQFGTNTIPGTTDMTAALVAAAEYAHANGGGVVHVSSDIYLSSTTKLESLTDVTINCHNNVIHLGEDATPGIWFKGCTRTGLIDAKVDGDRTTHGDWENLVTGLAIASGDGTGTADANVTAGSTDTITVNNLDGGNSGAYVKKGARLSYIVSSVVYAYIVQSDALITSGSATVTLDRVIDADITLGQAVYVNEWNRNAVLASAASASATTLTLQVPDPSSNSGTPKLMAGDQFAFYTDNNDIDGPIDYSEVYTVVSDVNFSGSYPAYTATVTITPALSTDKVNGQMITSIMDHRNNRFVPVLFTGCTGGYAENVHMDDSRLHGLTFNAVIDAPWDGVAPSSVPNVNCWVRDCEDSNGGQGAAWVSAWAQSWTVEGCYFHTPGTGKNRMGTTHEKGTGIKIVWNKIYNAYAGVNSNGNCEHCLVAGNYIKDPVVAIWQRNEIKHSIIQNNMIELNATDSIAGIVAYAGPKDAGTDRRRSMLNIFANQIFGGTSVANATYGSAIQVGPISNNASAGDDDAPHGVNIRDNFIEGAGRHGINIIAGVHSASITGNKIYDVGYVGINAPDIRSSEVLHNFVQDCGTASSSDAYNLPDTSDVVAGYNRAEKVNSLNMTASLPAIAPRARVARVSRASGVSHTSGSPGAWQVITWDTEDVDDLGVVDLATYSGRIVDSMPYGVSRIKVSCGVIFAANATGERGLRVMVGGARVDAAPQLIIPATGSGSCSLTLTTGWVEVSQGQKVEVQAYQSSGGTLAMQPFDTYAEVEFR